MRSFRWLGAFLLLTLMLGCASGKVQRVSKLPYSAWSLGFFSPDHMEAYIESVEILDARDRLFASPSWGLAAFGTHGHAAGWKEPYAFGNSNSLAGAALPKRLYVRWQSLIEPKTYYVFLDIDERTRRLMLLSDPPPVGMNFPKDHRFYRKYLVLGLAPGGWVKGWVTSASGDPIEVLCTRGDIEPKGPSQGLNEGRYAYALDKLEPTTQQYLKTHPIPFDSWSCKPSA